MAKDPSRLNALLDPRSAAATTNQKWWDRGVTGYFICDVEFQGVSQNNGKNGALVVQVRFVKPGAPQGTFDVDLHDDSSAEVWSDYPATLEQCVTDPANRFGWVGLSQGWLNRNHLDFNAVSDGKWPVGLPDVARLAVLRKQLQDEPRLLGDDEFWNSALR